MVGAGRVATALAALLASSGHRVVAASGRERSAERVARFLPGTRFVEMAEAAAAAPVVILGVPDDAIETATEEISGAISAGSAIVHLSGSAPLASMDAAVRAGAHPLSLHPLQTVTDVESGLEVLPGSWFAVTARDEGTAALGDRLARDAGGKPFRLDDGAKALYHAGAVFASNYLAVVEEVAERLLREAGVGSPMEALEPLVRTTLDNVMRAGPRAALTGPAARGDAGTVRRNLAALRSTAPDAAEAYVALARLALAIAESSGRLDRESRVEVEEVLSAWR